MDEGYGVPPPTAQEVLPKTGRSSLKYKRRGFRGVRVFGKGVFGGRVFGKREQV